MGCNYGIIVPIILCYTREINHPQNREEPATHAMCFCEGYKLCCKYNTTCKIFNDSFFYRVLFKKKKKGKEGRKKKFLKCTPPPDNQDWEGEKEKKKKKAGSMWGLFAYSYETVLHFLLITLTCFSWLSSSICVTSA